MTRKTCSDKKEEGSDGEGRDYMKLKTILEGMITRVNQQKAYSMLD